MRNVRAIILKINVKKKMFVNVAANQNIKDDLSKTN